MFCCARKLLHSTQLDRRRRDPEIGPPPKFTIVAPRVKFDDVTVMVSVWPKVSTLLGNFGRDADGQTARLRANFLGESHFGKLGGSPSRSAGLSC